jgi:hypothetical protein
VIKVSRAVLAHLWLTGISQHHLAALVAEPATPWEVPVEDHRSWLGSALLDAEQVQGLLALVKLLGVGQGERTPLSRRW